MWYPKYQVGRSSKYQDPEYKPRKVRYYLSFLLILNNTVLINFNIIVDINIVWYIILLRIHRQVGSHIGRSIFVVLHTRNVIRNIIMNAVINEPNRLWCMIFVNYTLWMSVNRNRTINAGTMLVIFVITFLVTVGKYHENHKWMVNSVVWRTIIHTDNSVIWIVCWNISVVKYGNVVVNQNTNVSMMNE